jgi:tetratricopeptide (TPR) repeat protein
MVLCSLQVDSFSALSGTSVTDFSRTNLGLNQPTYDRLKLALNLNLRRQIFIAVCDDLPLRDRLAMRLQAELAHFTPPALASGITEPRVIPKLVTLDLDLHDPNPIVQVLEWLSHFPTPSGRHSTIPAFQILGIEALTRQSASLQSVFLAYLETVEQQLPLIESCLLLWMTQPWYRLLPEAAPEFWQCRTGVFKFIGDPTPLPVTSPERIQLPSSNISDLSGIPPIDADRSASPVALPKSVANPWLPLAEDLTSWYEPDATGDRDPSDPAVQANSDDLQSAYDQWIAAFSQAFDQELPTSDLRQIALKLFTASNPTTSELVDPETATPAETQLADSSNAYLSPEDLSPEEAATDHVLADLDFADLLTPEAQAILDTAVETDPLLQQIEILQQQIAMLQQEQESPAVLATAYRTLGNFYRDCIEQGDASAENLTIAVQAYELALQWLPESEQAETLNDLASLYWLLSQTHSSSEEVSGCLQQAIQTYEMAVKHLNPETQPQLYTLVQNNLAAVYADLANHQQPVVNLQQSIAAYEQVLLHRPSDADPSRYASTYNNLGTAYWNLAQHQQPELNLKQAVAAYTQALDYYSPEQEPMHYAMIHNNLGTAYWNLAQYNQPEHYLKLAVSAYHAALEYRTLDTVPVHFAATQNNLGTAYWHLSGHTPHKQERLTHLEQAIAAYSTTLEIVALLSTDPDQPRFNFDLASTQNNLGLAHYQIAIEGVGLDANQQNHHLKAALQHHLLALQSWEQQPELHQIALNCIVQTVKGFYNQLGLAGQNQALSQIPGSLLSEILPKL